MDAETKAKLEALEKIKTKTTGIQTYNKPVSATAIATTKILPSISTKNEEELKLAREGRHPLGLLYDSETDTYYIPSPPEY